MQFRCRNCNRPFGMKRDEVHALLTAMHTERLRYSNVHCPHCGKSNKVTKNELQRMVPGWSPERAATLEEADSAGPSQDTSVT